MQILPKCCLSVLVLALMAGCNADRLPPKSGAYPALPGASTQTAPGQLAREEPDWAKEKRNAMVELIANYDPVFAVTDSSVLDAMRHVPRHKFVPKNIAKRAYDNGPLPIGEGQTISQPFIVGYMTQVLELKSGDKVLEIGTGSGYQAAILAELGAEVYTIEIIESLAKNAQEILASLGYKNIRVKAGDGYRGWPKYAPFDAIIVTCAPEHIPKPLIDQLKTGGRMIIPVGGSIRGLWSAQELILVRKTRTGMRRERQFDVRFVPMTGEARK